MEVSFCFCWWRRRRWWWWWMVSQQVMTAHILMKEKVLLSSKETYLIYTDWRRYLSLYLSLSAVLVQKASVCFYAVGLGIGNPRRCLLIRRWGGAMAIIAYMLQTTYILYIHTWERKSTTSMKTMTNHWSLSLLCLSLCLCRCVSVSVSVSVTMYMDGKKKQSM